MAALCIYPLTMFCFTYLLSLSLSLLHIMTIPFFVPMCWSCVSQYFTVQPTLEGFRWAVERTFEEFSRLHKTVRVLKNTFFTCMMFMAHVSA